MPNSFFFDLDLDREDAVQIFRYEELVTKPQRRFSRMFDFCDCPFQPGVTREVFASSIARDSVPEIDPAIRELCQEIQARFDGLRTSTGEVA